MVRRDAQREVYGLSCHPDAPAWLRFKFCENARELDETLEGYRGWISRGWVQTEEAHVDVLPATLSLPRRYAFRYVRIDVLALSSRYRLTVEDAWAEATTSADDAAVMPCGGDERDAAIDRIALRTLRSCMQSVFEDGPKRDRRLWLGDLRLQALANYATYRNNDLVKRCLYLFAGVADDEGRLPACLFLEPNVEADDTCMFDYALFYIPVLLEYLRQTGDREEALELLPTALRQLELSEEQFDGDLVRDSDRLGWCFVDWNLDLNKQASAQAIWIYCAKSAMELCDRLHAEMPDGLEGMLERRCAALREAWFEPAQGVFVSGAGRQVSWASQVWAVLAGGRRRRGRGQMSGCRRGDPGRCGHGHALHDAPLCRGVVPRGPRGGGPAGDAGLLGRDGGSWRGYLLGAVQSRRSG